MTSSRTNNALWRKISQASGVVPVVVFNLLSGFLTCISGSLVCWINNDNVNKPLSTTTTTTGRCCGNNSSNNNQVSAHSSSVLTPKWIWTCTWILIFCLLQVELAEGIVTSSEGKIITYFCINFFFSCSSETIAFLSNLSYIQVDLYKERSLAH